MYVSTEDQCCACVCVVMTILYGGVQCHVMMCVAVASKIEFLTELLICWLLMIGYTYHCCLYFPIRDEIKIIPFPI